MIEVEIKSVLDDDLNREKILKLRPENVDAGAIEVFQRIFVEILNFDIVRGTFGGVAESVSTQDWNKQAEAVEACIIAERDDFRVLYVELRKLTRTAQRYAVSSIIRERWASKGEFVVIFYAQGSDVWHLVCPYVTEGRTILRRYVVGIGEKHRTVSRNLANMDVTMEAPLFERVQDAFRLKPVTEQFYDDYKNYFSKIKEYIRSLGIDIRNSKRYSHLFLNRLMFVYFIQKKGWIGDNKEFAKWFLEAYREFGEKDRFHEKWLNNLFFNAMTKPPREKKFSLGFPSEVREVLNSIPYLNGGLFEKDDVDEVGIELPDSLVMEVIEGFLENYNFTITEESPFDLDIAVDPAMLGKIYESLIAEEERGKAGIFYTPRIEVDLMCRLALYEYFQQQRTDKSETLEEALVNQLLERVIDFLFTPLEEWKTKDESEFRVLKNALDSVKITDPACGSGAFLVGMLNVLQELYTKMGVEADYNLKENIVNNNLYGVDIKDWAVRMAEFRLWLALVESEDKVPDVEPVLPNFSFKLRVGDSIVQKIGDEFISLEDVLRNPSPRVKDGLAELEKMKTRYFLGESRLIKDIHGKQLEIINLHIDELVCELERKRAENRQTTLKGEITEEAKRLIKKIDAQIENIRQTKTDLNQARGAGKFIWDLDFPEVMLNGGFDIVVTNPPYVRQNRIIDQGLDPEEVETYSDKKVRKLKEQYKHDLLKYVQKYHDIYIGKRSDLYVYFFFKALKLIRQKGTFVFISSNSWLDVGFGKFLQGELLRNSELRYVIDTSARRSFENSAINTVITVAKKHEPNILSGQTTFLMFNRAYEDIMYPAQMNKALLGMKKKRQMQISGETFVFMADDLLRRVSVQAEALWRLGGGETKLAQKSLDPECALGAKPAGNYEGGKWGKYLRAPTLYFDVLATKSNLFTTLRGGNDASVFLGITTGNDSFFYLGKKAVDHWDIEDKFLRQVIKSPREILRYTVDKKACTKYVLYVPYTKDELKGTKALKYIQEGEKLGVPDGDFFNSCDDSDWYRHSSIINAKRPKLVCPYQPYERHFTSWVEDKIYVHKQLVGIHASNSYAKLLFIFFNSTFGILVKELEGRTNFGEGSVQTSVEDYKDMPVLRSLRKKSVRDKVNAIIDQFLEEQTKVGKVFDEISPSSEEFSPEKVTPHRQGIDQLIMGEILGLTEKEQHEVYKAVVGLVARRISKARSV